MLKKTFDSFKIYTSAVKFEKLRWRNAMKFEHVKLLTTAFKTLQWYKNKKKALHHMELKTDAVYCRLAKRRGLKTFVKNTREMIHRRRLNKCADKFYNHQLHLRYFEMFKNFIQIQKGIKNQEFCILSYHKERTMLNVFSALKKYSKEKKEYRTNALIFKHRGYQRKLVYLWRVVVSKKSIQRQPDNGAFYFVSYIWLKTVFKEENEGPTLNDIPNKNLASLYYTNSLPISNRPKYENYYREANKKLSNYVLSKIFKSWKDQSTKAISFRKNRSQKLTSKIFEVWSDHTNKSMIQRSKLNEIRAKFQKRKLENIFDEMKEYLWTKIDLKRRMKHYQEISNSKTTKKYFFNWRIKQSKQMIHSEQDVIADQMYKKHFQKYFFVWHDKFIRYQILNREDRKLETFQN